MNKLLESARIALAAIWAAKLRSFMTVLGNIVAVTSIIAVVSLIQGLNASVRSAILNQAGADSFGIQQFPITRTDEEFDRVRSNPRISLQDVRAIRRLGGDSITAVMAQSNAGARITYRGNSIDNTQVRGVTAEYIDFSTFDAERGRLMSPPEVEREQPVVVLGWQTAERLFGGDIDPLDKVIQIAGAHFRVVGVSAKRGTVLGNTQDEFAVIPLGQFQMLFGARRQLSVSVKPRDLGLIRAAMDDATVALRSARRLKPKQPDNFGVFTSDTFLDIYRSFTSGIFAVLVGIVGLSLVVGGIVIMNIMLMVVSERTREIGLRKALGARRSDIMAQMLTESVVLSMFGGVLGTLFGSSIAIAISRLTPIPASVEAWSAALGIGITAAVGLFFGLYPAMRAARMDPIEALREGIAGVMRTSLFAEVVAMALDTVRTNKMRSGLTVLGVVIGVTSIVGMTALIRGFDQSLRDSIRAIGPNTIFIQRFGVTSFANGAEFRDLLKRPTLSVSDARALEDQADTLALVDIELGAGGPPTQRRVFFRDQKTRNLVVFGTSENFAEGTRIPILGGRYFNGTEVQYRKNIVVLGNTPYKVLFEPFGIDPIGKLVRVGNQRFEVVGVFDKRPSAGGFNLGQDDFVVIPYTTYQRIFGLRTFFVNRGGAAGSIVPVQIAVVPREGVAQADAIADVERVMRSRHDLRLDQPNDFDIVTQDAFLQLWDRISQATFFALVVISSIALMVGGIGVMAIMSISVTERTREIGVRKALGARRSEILFQFLMEAAFLTSIGGVLGILLGASIGWAVHLASGFPISLPWWSFAIGLGFSASVGIFFGMYPAIKASRLDPIEALRYE